MPHEILPLFLIKSVSQLITLQYILQCVNFMDSYVVELYSDNKDRPTACLNDENRHRCVSLYKCFTFSHEYEID